MQVFEERWVRVRLLDDGEAVDPPEARGWVADWPRRRLAHAQAWGGEPLLCVVEWPVGADVGSFDDITGVGLFFAVRVACVVCGRDFVGLRADADGWGPFDRWRDGVHDVLKACPSCGAGRRDADLMRILAGPIRPAPAAR